MTWLLLLGSFWVGACGVSPRGLSVESLSLQPQIVSVAPNEALAIGGDTVFDLSFSTPIEASSLEDGIVLARGDVQEVEWKSAKPLAVTMAIDDEGRHISVRPVSLLVPGEYSLLITPRLMSVDRYPFNAQPGDSPHAYVGHYVVDDSLPALGDVGADESGMPEADDFPTPASAIIHEVYYDGPTGDTNGLLFVELRIETSGSLNGMVIRCLNGADGKVTDTMSLPDVDVEAGTLFVVADTNDGSSLLTSVAVADWLDDFDPQNGPDSIQLVAADGFLLDALAYGGMSTLVSIDGLAMGEGDPAPDAPAGMSLSRRPGEGDTGNNAADFEVNTQPSPGLIDVIPL